MVKWHGEIFQGSGRSIVVVGERHIALSSREPSNDDSDDDWKHKSFAAGKIFLVEWIIRLFCRSPCCPGKGVEQDGDAQGKLQEAGEEAPPEESLLSPWLLGDRKDIRGDAIFLNGARI